MTTQDTAAARPSVWRRFLDWRREPVVQEVEVPAEPETPTPQGEKPKQWVRLRAGIRRSILVGGGATFAILIGIFALNNWLTISSIWPKGQVVIAESAPTVEPPAPQPAAEVPALTPEPAPPVIEAGLTEKQREEVVAAIQTAISQIPQQPRQDIDLNAVATQVASLEGKVGNLPAQVNYQPQINALTGAVEGQATQIAALEAGVERLNTATTSTFDGLSQRLAAVEQVAGATSTTTQQLSESDLSQNLEIEEMKKTLAALAAAAALAVTAPSVASAADAYVQAPAPVVGIDCNLNPNACAPAPQPQGCYIEVALEGQQAATVDVSARGPNNGKWDRKGLPINAGLNYVPIDCDVASQATWIQVCLSGSNVAQTIEGQWIPMIRNNLTQGPALNPGQPMVFRWS